MFICIIITLSLTMIVISINHRSFLLLLLIFIGTPPGAVFLMKINIHSSPTIGRKYQKHALDITKPMTTYYLAQPPPPSLPPARLSSSAISRNYKKYALNSTKPMSTTAPTPRCPLSCLPSPPLYPQYATY